VLINCADVVVDGSLSSLRIRNCVWGVKSRTFSMADISSLTVALRDSVMLGGGLLVAEVLNEIVDITYIRNREG
jgi:hypothetical protein